LAISYTCFSDIVLRIWCPGFWLPDEMPAARDDRSEGARGSCVG
jgi:hypothetical protein